MRENILLPAGHLDIETMVYTAGRAFIVISSLEEGALAVQGSLVLLLDVLVEVRR